MTNVSEKCVHEENEKTEEEPRRAMGDCDCLLVCDVDRKVEFFVVTMKMNTFFVLHLPLQIDEN